jgi:SAM-dependent methyltransferase
LSERWIELTPFLLLLLLFAPAHPVMAATWRPLPRVHALAVLQRIQGLLQMLSMPECPGLPVNILTPHECPLDPTTTWFTPKYDGDRLLCFGEYHGKSDRHKGHHKVLLHFVDRAMQVFMGGVITTSQPVSRSSCNFLLDGEFCKRSNSLHVFDILVYKGKTCLDARTLSGRMKFAVAVLHMLGSPRKVVPRCGLRMLLKPMFAAASLPLVADTSKHGVPVDGVVALDTAHLKSRPKKWKPPEKITCDFLLANNQQLYVSGGSGRNLVYVDSVALPHKPYAVPVIVECRYDHTKPSLDPSPDSCLPQGQWVIDRVRKDKSVPNSIQVYERNTSLMLAPFPLRQLLKKPTAETATATGATATGATPPQAKRGRTTPARCNNSSSTCLATASSRSPASSYYAQTAVTRSQSKSVHMKNFHNVVVKDHAYRTYLTKQTTHVLELGVGRGGDQGRLVKYGCNCVEKIVCVDVDPDGLREAEKRWQRASRAFHKPPDTTFVERDLTSAYITEKFADEHWHEFDFVSAQFSVHYFMEQLYEWLPNVVKEGGVFVCTLFDGAAVRALLEGEPDGKKEWTIDGQKQAELVLDADEGTVSMWMDTIGKHQVEPLHDIDFVVDTMKGRGFECVERRPFATFPWGGFPATDPMRSFSNLYVLLAFRRKKDTTTTFDDDFTFSFD